MGNVGASESSPSDGMEQEDQDRSVTRSAGAHSIKPEGAHAGIPENGMARPPGLARSPASSNLVKYNGFRPQCNEEVRHLPFYPGGRVGRGPRARRPRDAG